MRTIAVFLFLCLSRQMYAQIDTISWTKGKYLPQSLALGQFGNFLIDSDLYVAGGWINSVGSSPFSDNVWRYHIPTDTWFEMSHLPLGSAVAASFSLNGKGYLLTCGDSSTSYLCSSKFWEYDPIRDIWTALADLPDSTRINSSCFTYGGKGYVGQTGICSIPDSHFWEYDPTTNRWTQVASLPANIAGGSTGILFNNSNAYLFGGYEFSGFTVGDIWQYDILADHWDSIGQIPNHPRDYIILWGCDSTIIVGGGTDATSMWNDYHFFDVLNNSWKPVIFQNFPDSAVSGFSFIKGKTAYYFGGTTNPNGDFFDSVGIWSADVSKYVHDTTTGVSEPSAKPLVSVYPNPINQSQSFFISVGQRAQVTFVDALGRVIGEQPLNSGSNRIKLSVSDDVIFYRIIFGDGESATGKVVMMQ